MNKDTSCDSNLWIPPWPERLLRCWFLSDLMLQSASTMTACEFTTQQLIDWVEKGNYLGEDILLSLSPNQILQLIKHYLMKLHPTLITKPAYRKLKKLICKNKRKPMSQQIPKVKGCLCKLPESRYNLLFAICWVVSVQSLQRCSPQTMEETGCLSKICSLQELRLLVGAIFDMSKKHANQKVADDDKRMQVLSYLVLNRSEVFVVEKNLPSKMPKSSSYVPADSWTEWQISLANTFENYSSGGKIVIPKFEAADPSFPPPTDSTPSPRPVSRLIYQVECDNREGSPIATPSKTTIIYDNPLIPVQDTIVSEMMQRNISSDQKQPNHLAMGDCFEVDLSISKCELPDCNKTSNGAAIGIDQASQVQCIEFCKSAEAQSGGVYAVNTVYTQVDKNIFSCSYTGRQLYALRNTKEEFTQVGQEDLTNSTISQGVQTDSVLLTDATVQVETHQGKVSTDTSDTECQTEMYFCTVYTEIPKPKHNSVSLQTDSHFLQNNIAIQVNKQDFCQDFSSATSLCAYSTSNNIPVETERFPEESHFGIGFMNVGTGTEEEGECICVNVNALSQKLEGHVEQIIRNHCKRLESYISEMKLDVRNRLNASYSKLSDVLLDIQTLNKFLHRKCLKIPKLEGVSPVSSTRYKRHVATLGKGEGDILGKESTRSIGNSTLHHLLDTITSFNMQLNGSFKELLMNIIIAESSSSLKEKLIHHINYIQYLASTEFDQISSLFPASSNSVPALSDVVPSTDKLISIQNQSESCYLPIIHGGPTQMVVNTKTSDAMLRLIDNSEFMICKQPVLPSFASRIQVGFNIPFHSSTSDLLTQEKTKNNGEENNETKIDHFFENKNNIAKVQMQHLLDIEKANQALIEINHKNKLEIYYLRKENAELHKLISSAKCKLQTSHNKIKRLSDTNYIRSRYSGNPEQIHPCPITGFTTILGECNQINCVCKNQISCLEESLRMKESENLELLSVCDKLVKKLSKLGL